MTDARTEIMATNVDEATTDEQDDGREAFLQSLELESGHADQVGLDVYIDHLGERLREREDEIARTREIAQRRIEMIQSWANHATAQVERECVWIRLQIEANAQFYDFGKKKSRELPHVTFGYRARPATLNVVDMPAAVAFAEAHELEIKKTVNKTPLVGYFKTHGGIIPDGCEYVDGSDDFFVKTAG